MVLSVLTKHHTASDIANQFYRRGLDSSRDLKALHGDDLWYDAQSILSDLHDSSVGFIVGGDYARAQVAQALFVAARHNPLVYSARVNEDSRQFRKYYETISIDNERELVRKHAKSFPWFFEKIAKDFVYNTLMDDVCNEGRASLYFDEKRFRTLLKTTALGIPALQHDANAIADYFNNGIAISALRHRDFSMNCRGESMPVAISPSGKWSSFEGSYTGMQTVCGLSAFTYEANNAFDYYGRCKRGDMLSGREQNSNALRFETLAFAADLGEAAGRRVVRNGRTVVEEFDVIAAYNTLARSNDIDKSRIYKLHKEYLKAEHFGGILMSALNDAKSGGWDLTGAFIDAFEEHDQKYDFPTWLAHVAGFSQPVHSIYK